MLRMKELGAKTIAQDKASSVVWGMPRVATEMGAALSVVDLHSVAGQICHYLSPDS